MGILSGERIAELLEPFVPGEALGPDLIEQISLYLDLLVRWNARVSLTSIKSPEEMVVRHFGESLFTAAKLRERVAERAEILDFGSGAGFPGVPVQMMLPGVRVTLAESQARKVAFLREVIRVLGLQTEVWPRRVEEMPAERRFDVVTMRAVDRMELAVRAAEERVRQAGWLALLVGAEWAVPQDAEVYPLPGAESRRLVICRVPRGTLAAAEP